MHCLGARKFCSTSTESTYKKNSLHEVCGFGFDFFLNKHLFSILQNDREGSIQSLPTLPSKINLFFLYASIQPHSFLNHSCYYIVLSCLVHLFLLLGHKLYWDSNHFSSFYVYSSYYNIRCLYCRRDNFHKGLCQRYVYSSMA